MRPFSLRRSIPFALVVLLLPACSDSGDGAADTTLAPTTTTEAATTTTEAATTTTEAATRTTTAPTTTAAPAPTTEPTLTLTLIASMQANDVAADDDEVWVVSTEANSVSVISVATREVVAKITDVCDDIPVDVALDEEHAWISCREDGVRAIDRASREVVATVDVGVAGTLALSDGAVWVIDRSSDAGAVSVLDPTRFSLRETIVLPGTCNRAADLVGAGDHVWVASITTDSCAGNPITFRSSRIDVIDPGEAAVVWSSQEIGGVSVRLAAADGEVWASGISDDNLTVIDASSELRGEGLPVTSIELAEVGPDLGRSNSNDRPVLTASDELVWVLNQTWAGAESEAVAIDRLSRRVIGRVPLDDPRDVAAVGEAAWVAYQDGVGLVAP